MGRFCWDSGEDDGEIGKDAYNRMINRQKQQLKTAKDRKEIIETPNRGKIEPQLMYSMSLINNIDSFSPQKLRLGR